jgi:DNA-binding MarR family transcriptional regulator
VTTASSRRPSTLQPHDPGEIATRLRVSATRLARRLRQQADAGLTPSQLSALVSVECHGPVTLGALAEHERVAPPSITKVVAKLEAAGLVTRTVDDRDRRVMWVSVTPAGQQRLTKTRERKNAWLTARLAQLDDEQRGRLADALDALDALSAESR